MIDMDLRGNLSKNLYNLWRIINISLWNPIIYCKTFLYGIKIGKSCNFWGNMTLVRKPNSIIIIGNNCIFLSNSNSNLIGINRNCIIHTLTEKANITIGNNCGFSGTVVAAAKSIILENNVRCGANTTITDSDWHLDDPRSSPPKEIHIEENVWLGANVIVLKGVRIGKNTLIGANSVVSKSIPANTIAAGNPCKVIRSLPNLIK
jgi:acetyltransferase-like isoleucine patch superfamily enzyme